MKIGPIIIVMLLLLHPSAVAQQNPAPLPEKPAPSSDTPDQSGERSVQEILSSLKTVKKSKLREGLSATYLMGRDLHGADGEQIGEIQDLQFRLPGTLETIVVETGGILGGALDVGDTTFRFPWSEVDLSRGFEDIRISITEEKAERRGLTDQSENVEVGANEFLGSELIRGNVYVPGTNIHAVVDDIIFDRQGKIIAILADMRSLIEVTEQNLPFRNTPGDLPPGSLDMALALEAVDIAEMLPRKRKPVR